MRHLIAIAIAAAAFIACNGEPPPPPPVCEELPECAGSGGTWDADACSCDCGPDAVFLEDKGCEPVSPPPPPPPPPPVAKSCDTPISERVRSDYIPTNQAGFWEREIIAYDQRLINNGVRNPAFALEHCPPSSAASVWPFNGVSAEDARDYIPRARDAKEALTGADGESGFVGRFGEPNRRCSGPGDPWCGRSNVYRPCFNETWHEVRAVTDGCTVPDCTEFFPPTRPRGFTARVDGIRAACQENLR